MALKTCAGRVRAAVMGVAVAGMLAGTVRGQSSGSLPPVPEAGRSSRLPEVGSSGTSGSFTLENGVMKMRGQTQPAARVEVPSVLRGQLMEVGVKEGEAVKKGQVLAKLDDAMQVLAVQAAQLEASNDAEVRLAQAQIDYAKNEYERIRTNGSASEFEKRQKQLAVTQAEISLDFQKAKLLSAQLKLKQEQTTLERMTIRSPIEGLVLRVPKQAGEQTDENPVAVVVQTNKLTALFFPPRSMFGKITAGEKVKLTMETDPQIEREAVVTAVDPAVDPAGLFRVKLEVDNTDGKIPAGTPANWSRPVGSVAAGTSGK
jgi:RND family efflux transporter MFP subunit